MTALIERRPAPVMPTGGWQERAACRDARDGLDLAQLTSENADRAEAAGGVYEVEDRVSGRQVRVYADDLAAARMVCGACPVLTECRLVALGGTDIAGFAGGMTEDSRAAWRVRRNLRVAPITAADTVQDGDLTGPWMAERAERVGTLQARVDAVLALTRQGLHAEEVASRLGLTAAQVRHVHQLQAGSKSSRAVR